MEWHCTSFLYLIYKRETILTVSDRLQEVLFPFVRKRTAVRKLSDRKIKRLEFTRVDHIHW